MKFFNWIIVVPCRPAGFLAPVSSGSYLVSLCYGEGGLIPQFSPDKPQNWGYRSARFLVKEMRRVGYHAGMRPYALFAFCKWFVARRAARKAARANDPWKK